MRLFTLRNRDFARRQNSNRRRSWDREFAMRTVDPARALGHWRRDNARLSEQLQRDASADNIDNGIDSSYFVKVN